MQVRTMALRSAAVFSVAVAPLASGALNAQAVTKSGYKYCSGGSYVVSLTATATAAQKHVHKTGNGNRTITSPGAGTLELRAIQQ
jgi:hypothetical protein